MLAPPKKEGSPSSQVAVTQVEAPAEEKIKVNSLLSFPPGPMEDKRWVLRFIPSDAKQVGPGGKGKRKELFITPLGSIKRSNFCSEDDCKKK